MAEGQPTNPARKWAAYSKTKRQRRIDAGLCLACGGPRGDNGTLTCDPCRDKMKERGRRAAERKRAVRPPKPVPATADMKAYRRAWRLRMEAAGICTNCGANAAVPGRNRCEACVSADRDNYATDPGRRKRIIDGLKAKRLAWREQGLCDLCGDPPAPARKRCAACNRMLKSCHRAIKAKRRLKGLCPRCGEAPRRNRRECQACLEKRKAEYRKLRETNPSAVLAKWHRRRARLEGNGGSFTAAEWEQVKAAQDHTCLMCGKREPEIALHVDHVLPISKNGPSFASNLQGLCESCNKSKGANCIDLRHLAKHPHLYPRVD